MSDDSLKSKISSVLGLIRPLENAVIIFSGITMDVRDNMIKNILDMDEWDHIKPRNKSKFINHNLSQIIHVFSTDDPETLYSTPHSFVLLQGNPHSHDWRYTNVHRHARLHADNLIYFKV